MEEDPQKKLEEALLFRETEINVKGGPYICDKTFEDLLLPDDLDEDLFDGRQEIYDKLIENGFSRPSSIQGASIPLITTKDKKGGYKSILAQAQNGSGKTLAFILAAIMRCQMGNQLQCIIIEPTAELVYQTSEYFDKLKPDWFKYTAVTQNNDIDWRGLGQAVIITPNVLCLNYKNIPNLGKLKMLIIDECDDITDNTSFHEDLIKLSEFLKSNNIQFLLFSATIKDSLREYQKKFLTDDDVEITLPTTKIMNTTNQHFYINCSNTQEKIDFIEKIFDFLQNYQTFIFVKTRKMAGELESILKRKNYSVVRITGGSENFTKEQRKEILDKFRAQKIKVLITTDLLARGIDVPTAKVVINFEMPFKGNIETYLHRQGRVGRFGKNGKVISLITDEEGRNVIKTLRDEYNAEFIEIKKDQDLSIFK